MSDELTSLPQPIPDEPLAPGHRRPGVGLALLVILLTTLPLIGLLYLGYRLLNLGRNSMLYSRHHLPISHRRIPSMRSCLPLKMGHHWLQIWQRRNKPSAIRERESGCSIPHSCC